jgi:hypothetical protein
MDNLLRWIVRTVVSECFDTLIREEAFPYIFNTFFDAECGNLDGENVVFIAEHNNKHKDN